MNFCFRPVNPVPPADPRRWLVLAITASGLFLICVDITVLYVALPALTRDLQADNSQRLWILNAYPIVVAGLLPGFGTLGDRHGHRLLFTSGLVTFGVASLAAAFAADATTLIGARALLGVGAALMMPATLAIIRASFTDTRERAVAIGVWSGVASGGMALGPLVAGMLLARYEWGAVFLINVPVVLLALALTPLAIRQRMAPGGPPWDIRGSLLLLGALAALIYAIKEPARQDFSALRLAAAVTMTAICGVGYSRSQRHRPRALLEFSLFRLPDFAAAFSAACLGTAGVVGIELVLSQYLQLIEQRTPLAAALVLLPSALAGLVAGVLSGRLQHRFVPRHLAGSAFAVAALSVAALALLPTHWASFQVLRLVLVAGIGLGIGTTATFASHTIMNAAPAERAGMAASIEEVGFELGGALGVAVFGSLMTVVYSATLQLPAFMAAAPSAVRDSLDEAQRIASLLSAADQRALMSAADYAFTKAVQAVLLGVAALWLITGLCIATQRTRPDELRR
jgi:DHA2 family multidrug resistance protein-like MFS transporter